MRDIGRLELIRESLVAVVSEMRANVIRASYSSIIYEGHDFSCALVAADGRLVAQGVDDNPIHIFAVPYSAAKVVEAFGGDIAEGDIFLHNDPYTGGTHLNDVLMLYPVFHQGRLALFAATRCHWGDVGGMTPGSLSGRVREIYQEGLRIVPTRICERGRMNDAFLGLLFDNMRITRERQGDFKTMLGTSRKAAEHLERLFARFGGEALLAAVEELMARSERVMREKIAGVPDGTYHAEGYLDSDGHSEEPLLGRLRLTVTGERMVADFSGSSAQTAGPTNVGPAMAFNAVASIVKSFLDPHTPVNHGSFEPLEIVNPPGSFLNATLPAPCGGMVECRALMCGLVVSALGQALPDALVGDLKGGANHVYVSGPRPGSDGIYLLYEYPAGGTGATATSDGSHAVRAFPEGDFNSVQAVEVVEAQCPVRVVSYGIRAGSGGDGEFRGGCGARREIRILEPGASLSVLADKNVIPPFGVAAGMGGAANRFTVEREGAPVALSPIPGKVGGFALEAGDVVRIETSGGGGFGDPLARDPRRVADDVRLGVLDRAAARARYGVELDELGRPDAPATRDHRERLEAGRPRFELRESNRPSREHTRRILEVTESVARRAGVRAGELVELAGPASGASLRAWISIGDSGQSGESVEAGDAGIALDRSGLDVLGVEPGCTVELRPVRTVPA